MYYFILLLTVYVIIYYYMWGRFYNPMYCYILLIIYIQYTGLKLTYYIYTLGGLNPILNPGMLLKPTKLRPQTSFYIYPMAIVVPLV